MQKIKLKESYCFEEVPVGMMCIYPVSKQIESANSQLQKSVCVSMHHRKFHGQGNGSEPEKGGIGVNLESKIKKIKSQKILHNHTRLLIVREDSKVCLPR